MPDDKRYEVLQEASPMKALDSVSSKHNDVVKPESVLQGVPQRFPEHANIFKAPAADQENAAGQTVDDTNSTRMQDHLDQDQHMDYLMANNYMANTPNLMMSPHFADPLASQATQPSGSNQQKVFKFPPDPEGPQSPGDSADYRTSNNSHL